MPIRDVRAQHFWILFELFIAQKDRRGMGAGFSEPAAFRLCLYTAESGATAACTSVA